MGRESVTPQEALVLAATWDRARYGYELVDRIEELTEGRLRLRPGNLYRLLDRLMEKEMVEEVPDAPGAEEDDRRRYFRATVAGVEAATDELSMYGAALRRARADA